MSYYKQSDGLKYILEQRENGTDALFNDKRINTKQFPLSDKSYTSIFNTIERIMNEKWHPNVNLGAAINDNQLLTDHGVNHIESVISHSLDIIRSSNELTGFEIFLLLVAIHFHDVGNIYGREKHEQKIAEILDKSEDAFELDIAEREIITSIATAHGGTINEDKDTIRFVVTNQDYDSVPIRPRLLASILRYADEISDDVNRSFTNSNIKIPKENKVFHEYSKSLTPVSINGNTIKFHYRIQYENAIHKLGKGSEEIYLYDEIFKRLSKCMCELEYCRKYSDGIIKISTLDVRIDIIKKGSTFQPISSECFRLSLHGYPNKSSFNVLDYMEPIDMNNVGNKSDILKYQNGEDLCAKIKEEYHEQ